MRQINAREPRTHPSVTIANCLLAPRTDKINSAPCKRAFVVQALNMMSTASLLVIYSEAWGFAFLMSSIPDSVREEAKSRLIAVFRVRFPSYTDDKLLPLVANYDARLVGLAPSLRAYVDEVNKKLRDADPTAQLMFMNMESEVAKLAAKYSQTLNSLLEEAIKRSFDTPNPNLDKVLGVSKWIISIFRGEKRLPYGVSIAQLDAKAADCILILRRVSSVQSEVAKLAAKYSQTLNSLFEEVLKLSVDIPFPNFHKVLGMSKLIISIFNGQKNLSEHTNDETMARLDTETAKCILLLRQLASMAKEKAARAACRQGDANAEAKAELVWPVGSTSSNQEMGEESKSVAPRHQQVDQSDVKILVPIVHDSALNANQSRESQQQTAYTSTAEAASARTAVSAILAGGSKYLEVQQQQQLCTCFLGMEHALWENELCDRDLLTPQLDVGERCSGIPFRTVWKDWNLDLLGALVSIASAPGRLSHIRSLNLKGANDLVQNEVFALLAKEERPSLRSLYTENVCNQSEVALLTNALSHTTKLQYLRLRISSKSNSLQLDELFSVISSLPIRALTFGLQSNSSLHDLENTSRRLLFGTIRMLGPTLKYLNVRTFFEIPCNCSNLRALSVGEGLGEREVEKLCYSLSRMPHLIELSVCLRDKNAVERFTSFFSHFRFLVCLDVTGIWGYSELFDVLGRNTRLRHLSLTGNDFRLMKSHIENLAEIGWLTELSVDSLYQSNGLTARNGVRHAFCKKLCVVLLSLQKKVTSLKRIDPCVIRNISQILWCTRNQDVWDLQLPLRRGKKQKGT